MERNEQLTFKQRLDFKQDKLDDGFYKNVDEFINEIIAETGGDEGAVFFAAAESILLKALILYVLAEYPEDWCNLNGVYKILTECSGYELDAAFAVLAGSDSRIQADAASVYRLFSGAVNNKQAIMLGLYRRLTNYRLLEQAAAE